jgi:pimeloyl-ACP methyl ester carboxylesterase
MAAVDVGADPRERIAAAVPDGTAAIVSDAGHFPYAERPGEYLAAVRAFLA